MNEQISNEELIALAKATTQTPNAIVLNTCQRIGDKTIFINTCTEQLEHATSTLIRSLARHRLGLYLEIATGKKIETLPDAAKIDS